VPKKVKPIRIEGDVAYVPLTKGYEAVIDVEDVPLIKNYNWCADEKKHTVYAVRNGFKTKGKNGNISLHSQILEVPVGYEVDHADRNGLNNRRYNLRKSTKSQNNCNKGLLRNNTSGFKGVSWHKGNKKWASNIKLNRKKQCLGYFDTPEEAYAAYCAASERLHREFGRVK
jgi:hypothetical protein